MNNDLPVSITIITDCGGSDRGRYEIALQRCFWPQDWKLAFFETESKNTLHSGFTAAAHVLSTISFFGPLRDGERIGIIVNAAPRMGQENGCKLRGRDRHEEGEEIYGLQLRNGVWVVGPNAGLNLYFLKDEVVDSYLLTDERGLKTPFRSMEFMVPALAMLVDVNKFPKIKMTRKDLKVPVSESGIFVADWDSHGNIYLYSSLPESQWVPPIGEHVTIRIGNEIARLRHVEGIFAGHTGEQTMTKGSLKLLGREAIYYIVVVGSEAHSQLRHPPVGTAVVIERD
ncbi:MAG: hypothetical protein WAP74_02215 [Patescibacteria group bacterium]